MADLTETVARAIGRVVADGDDIDILESLENNFDWITEDQAERMVYAAAQAAIAALAATQGDLPISLDVIEELARLPTSRRSNDQVDGALLACTQAIRELQAQNAALQARVAGLEGVVV